MSDQEKSKISGPGIGLREILPVLCLQGTINWAVPWFAPVFLMIILALVLSNIFGENL
jgi:hypothetical protein